MIFKSSKKKAKVRKWEIEEDDVQAKDSEGEPDVNSESYKRMLKELEEQEEKERVEAEKKAVEKAKVEAEEARKRAEEERKKAEEEAAKKAREAEEAVRMEEKRRRDFQQRIEEFKKMPNPAVYLDIEAEGENDPLRPAASLKPFRGRLVFELFRDICPMTCENFRKLCTGELGPQLCYRGNEFHRIIPGFMAQAGDITHGDGTGGMSIYGLSFPDENFYHKHKWPGMLSMANSGPDSNGSQFYITLKKCSWLDNKHVVFGQIKDGMSTLLKIGKAGNKGGGEPKQRIRIVDCGEIDRDAVESLRNEDRKKARRMAREGNHAQSPSPIKKSERWKPGSNSGADKRRDDRTGGHRRPSEGGNDRSRSRNSRDKRRSSRDRRSSRSRDRRRSRSRDRRKSRSRDRRRSRSSERRRRRRRSDSR